MSPSSHLFFLLFTWRVYILRLLALGGGGRGMQVQPSIQRRHNKHGLLYLLSFNGSARNKLRDSGPSTAACPAFWGMGTIEIVYGEEQNIFVLGRLEQSRQNKNLLYRHDKLNEPTKTRPLSFVLFESPFTSVSTVSRGHPALVSMGSATLDRK